MIRGDFFGAEGRTKPIALARDGSAASRLTRRANALVLLDDGWNCQEVADALLLNDDTIRNWHKLFEQRGIEGPDQLRHGRQRELFDRRTGRRFESLCWRDAAALDAPSRRLYRAGIRPRLRKPFGTDRDVASPGARISQAGCRCPQARRGEAEGFHRELR